LDKNGIWQPKGLGYADRGGKFCWCRDCLSEVKIDGFLGPWLENLQSKTFRGYLERQRGWLLLWKTSRLLSPLDERAKMMQNHAAGNGEDRFLVFIDRSEEGKKAHASIDGSLLKDTIGVHVKTGEIHGS